MAFMFDVGHIGKLIFVLFGFILIIFLARFIFVKKMTNVGPIWKLTFVLFSLILIIFLVRYIPLSAFIPYDFLEDLPSCDSENHAWGDYKQTCICLGIKVDTSPPPTYSDYGTSRGCLGYPISKKCYTGDPQDGWSTLTCRP